MLNPGGSVKDRVALQIVQEAIAEGRLRPGGLISEGTAGDLSLSEASQLHHARGSAAQYCRIFWLTESCRLAHPLQSLHSMSSTEVLMVANC